MKTTDAIVQAVALLRSRTDLAEIAIFRELTLRGVERQTAARLVEFLPMVYCRLIFVRTTISGDVPPLPVRWNMLAIGFALQ